MQLAKISLEQNVIILNKDNIAIIDLTVIKEQNLDPQII